MTRIADDATVFTDHNVYILGAGFSADAGIPLLDDFLFQMRAGMNWLSEQNRSRECAAIKKVFRFRKDASSAALRVNLNVENIEDLFSLAAASGQYPLAESVSTAIAATLDYSARTAKLQCFEAVVEDRLRPRSWMVKNQADGASRCIIPPYDLYAGLLSGEVCSAGKFMKNTIITFNYDTVLERALATWKRPFWYGFKPQSVKYDDSSKCTRKKLSGALPILKLHGSVNWAKTTNGELRVYDCYDDVLRANLPVVLIPPTWRKVFPTPLSDVWDVAIQALTGATRVVIIGFSIPPTDMHFRFLLAAGLQENISLRTVSCFNPCLQVEENLFKILRPELRDQRIATFYPNYTRDFCIGRTNDYRPLGAFFNRAFCTGIGEIILGPEISLDLSADTQR